MRAIIVDDAGMRAGCCVEYSPIYNASRKPGSRARLLAEDEKLTGQVQQQATIKEQVQQQTTIKELKKQVAELSQ